MRKKAQLTVIIIIAIVLLIGVFFALRLTKNTVSEDLEGSGGRITTFAQDMNELKTIRDDCIDNAVKGAITYNSFKQSEENEERLEKVINARIYNCLDFAVISRKGYIIFSSYPNTSVEIMPETIRVQGTYPAKVLKQDSDESKFMNKFEYLLEKTTYTQLHLDEDGKTREEVRAVSNDAAFHLTIPEKTKLTNNNQPLESVSIEIRDKEELGYSNFYVLGNKIYDVSDSISSQGVKVTLDYDPFLIPHGFREEDLTLATYDEEREVWVSLPTVVNTESHTLTATVTHFSPLGPITGVKNKEEGYKKWQYRYDWFYIEHLHRSCQPQNPENPESDKRYIGLFNKGNSYEGPDEWRWKLNNFDNNPEEASHNGAVYALPQMYSTLLARGEIPNEYNAEWNKDREFEYSQKLDWNKLSIVDGNGNSVSADTLPEQRRVSARADEIFSNGNFDQITADRIPITSGDSVLDAFLILDEELRDPENWQKVNNPLPNEYAESDKNIQDWDDDDEFNLENNNCNGGSCVTCDGGSCTNLPNNGNLKSACISACYNKAENIYKNNFESQGWAPWNPSADGILDYKWKGDSLERNKINCNVGFVPAPGENVDCDEEPELCVNVLNSCQLDETDIATPKFYGYGDKKTGLREGQGKYRDEPELGYEGAGNNDHPVTKIFDIKKGAVFCTGNEAEMDIICSELDKCTVVVNEKETFTCNGGTCTVQIPEGTLKSGDNLITGWVTNTRNSQDVCAHVSVDINLRGCRGIDTPYPCKLSPERCTCTEEPDNPICEEPPESPCPEEYPDCNEEPEDPPEEPPCIGDECEPNGCPDNKPILITDKNGNKKCSPPCAQNPDPGETRDLLNCGHGNNDICVDPDNPGESEGCPPPAQGEGAHQPDPPGEGPQREEDENTGGGGGSGSSCPGSSCDRGGGGDNGGGPPSDNPGQGKNKDK